MASDQQILETNLLHFLEIALGFFSTTFSNSVTRRPDISATIGACTLLHESIDIRFPSRWRTALPTMLKPKGERLPEFIEPDNSHFAYTGQPVCREFYAVVS